jgi:hypothetical protein
MRKQGGGVVEARLEDEKRLVVHVQACFGGAAPLRVRRASSAKREPTIISETSMSANERG